MAEQTEGTGLKALGYRLLGRQAGNKRTVCPESDDLAADETQNIAKRPKQSREPFGLFEFTDEHENQNCEIELSFLGETRGSRFAYKLSVIAIHGLRGGYESTWTYKDSDGARLWLRDFLPRQLQESYQINARVMSFGYDSDLFLTSSTSDIDRVAAKLLNDLSDARTSEKEQSRPILLIAHSLGGLIVKKAMIYAHARSSEYGLLLERIRGVVFFGVPHRGADAAYWAKFAADLVGYLSLGSLGNASFVDTLKRNSKTWSTISKEFVERAAPLRIRTFYESDKIGNMLIVDENSALLNLPNEIAIEIPQSNHREICKFKSAESQRYGPVWKAIGRMAKDLIAKTGSSVQRHFLTDDEKHCLHTLYHSDYKHHKTRNSRPTLGTCEWILRHHDYLKWKDQASHNVLWVSADPGSGKSVLSRYLIDRLRSPENYDAARSNICYFFFKEDSDEQNHSSLALRAILHQLYRAQGELMEHALHEYERKGQIFMNEVGTLWSLLIKSTADERARETICIVDGLDECQKSSQVELMTLITEFFGNTSAGPRLPGKPRLKLLLTSRPYHLIEYRLTHQLVIRLKVENESDLIRQDVDTVVKERVTRFGAQRQVPKTVQDALTEKISRSADRTFLWASLVLDDLECSLRTSNKSLMSLIDLIPPSLDAMYEKILSQTTHRESARKILHIVLGANRPLSTTEMNIAFNIKPDDRFHRDIDIEPEGNIGTMIRHLCGLFVRVLDSKIYLIHQTAKTFLVGTNGLNDPETYTWKNSFPSIDSDSILVAICIMYLSLDDFDGVSPTSQPGSSWALLKNPTEDTIGSFVARFRFLDYAARYWTSHFRATQNEVNTCLLEMVNTKLYDTKTLRFYVSFSLNVQESDAGENYVSWSQPAPVHAASKFGHERIVEHLLAEGADIEENNATGQTALHVAVRENDKSMTLLLLDRQANILARDRHGWTVLHHAMEHCDEETVKMLLRKGANIHTINNGGETALHRAAEINRKDMIELLIDSGADTVVTDHDGRTPLHWASRSNCPQSVQALLDNGADIEAKNKSGNTALHYAMTRTSTACAEMLLDRGANIEARNCVGKSAIDEAYSWGMTDQIKLLKDRSASLTNLHAAILCNSAAYTQELLDRGADMEAKDEKGRCPLHLAVTCLNHVQVELLLNRGAQIEAKDNHGRTALHEAVLYAASRSTKLLLEKGANVEAADNRGFRPLHVAAQQLYADQLNLLMNRGAQIEATNGVGKTALLEAASLPGRSHSIKLLLNRGANIEAKDTYGRTALLIAATGDLVNEVKLLLDHGADIEARDNEGHTALALATIRQKKNPLRFSSGSIVELLQLYPFDSFLAWLTDG